MFDRSGWIGAVSIDRCDFACTRQRRKAERSIGENDIGQWEIHVRRCSARHLRAVRAEPLAVLGEQYADAECEERDRGGANVRAQRLFGVRHKLTQHKGDSRTKRELSTRIFNHKIPFQMSYRLRSKTPNAAAGEIILTAGLNSFCVDRYGVYDLTFTSCHTYDASASNSFRTGDETPLNIKALKHRNGVQIFSDIRSSFVALIERNGEKQHISFAEGTQTTDGKFSYRYDFDLKHGERVVVTPESDIVLFTPASAQLIGADDCVEVNRIRL